MKEKNTVKYRDMILLFLTAAGVAAVFLSLRGEMPGSKVDWIAQHSVFPDYFRKVFYETGEWYPDFAMQIGGGQNIFNFAYYGLLNPSILLSYFFPNIAMEYWIMGVSVLSYAFSGILFYCWIDGKRTKMIAGKKVENSSKDRRKKVTLSFSLEFWLTLLFMTAAPLFYHFCSQIMFVNYMPFLCLALIGTDRYFDKRKKGLLCGSVVLMILNSFYFSIGGILCLCLYALYSYIAGVENNYMCNLRKLQVKENQVSNHINNLQSKENEQGNDPVNNLSAKESAQINNPVNKLRSKESAQGNNPVNNPHPKESEQGNDSVNNWQSEEMSGLNCVRRNLRCEQNALIHSRRKFSVEKNFIYDAKTVETKNEMWNGKMLFMMFQEACQYMAVIFTGILLSSFFLVPTALALLSGRSSGNEQNAFDFINLFWPVNEPSKILYTNYGLGLGCIAIVAIIFGCMQKKISERVLSISLLVVLFVPIVGYALNGFLYNRGKVFIPFLPLVCMLIGKMIISLAKLQKNEYWKVVIAFLILTVYLILYSEGSKKTVYYWIDLLFVLASILVYLYWKQDFRIIMIPSLCISLIGMCFICMDKDIGLTKSDLNLEKREKIFEIMENITEEDSTFYRMEYYGNAKENFQNINRMFHVKQSMTSIYSSTYNSYYSEFRNRIFDVEKPNRNILMEGLNQNAIFRKIMGVKYWITEDLVVHTDLDTAPLLYGTSQIVSTEAYEKLEFPYNQLAFLKYAVAGNQDTGDREDTKNIKNTKDIRSIENARNVEDTSDVEGAKNTESIEEGDDTKVHSEIDAANSISYKLVADLKECFSLEEIDLASKLEKQPQGIVKVKIEASKEDRILLVQFHVKNKKNQDVTIDVEGSRNKLTAENHLYYNENTIFSYAVSLKAEQDEITLSFGNGDYEIVEPKGFIASLYAEKQVSKLEKSNGEEKIETSKLEKSNREKKNEPEITEGNNSLYESLFALDSMSCNAKIGTIKTSDSNRNTVDKNKNRFQNIFQQGQLIITGCMEMKSDGYLITSLPYDENFVLLIDGEVVETELVNEGFFGAKLSNGIHEIQLLYKAPGKQIGMMLTLLGILFACIYLVKNKISIQRMKMKHVAKKHCYKIITKK